MNEKKLWTEAAYYDGFRCKCGACRNCCCQGWNIALSMDEYFRLIGMECSDALRRRMDTAFHEPKEISPEHFRVIEPNWTGVCPMLDEDGLCMLQKECGEAALPEICRVYPRSLRREGRSYIACCSNSCEAVIELLMQTEKLELKTEEKEFKAELSDETDVSAKNRAAMELLQNRSMPLEERLARICGREETEDESVLFRSGMFCIEKLMEQSESLQMFAGEAMKRYAGEGGFARYREDIEAFESRFPRWKIVFENIIVNHLLVAEYPRVDARLDEKAARVGLQVVYAFMRIICAAYTREREGIEPFVDALAGIFRLIEHGPFYYNAYVLIGEKR